MSNGGLGGLNDVNNLNKFGNMGYNQSEDWEQVLKMAMMKSNANKQLEERNNILNMMGNGGGKPHNLLGKIIHQSIHKLFCNVVVFADFSSSQNFNGAMDPSLLFPMQREHQHQHNNFGPNDNLLGTDLLGNNMSKFFDFHKNQQQQHQQQSQHVSFFC